MATTVRSHAKINLGLYIGAPRPDGFHSLATVYQTMELHDLVTVSARPAPATALRLTSNDSRVPTDARNTAWKMVSLALEALGLTAEVEIHIDKRLPVQGGLGAGSGNAVGALVGLETELGLASQQVSEPASQRWRCATAGDCCPGRLGCAALPDWRRGSGAGPRPGGLSLPDFEPVWCVVATPEIGVSTPQAFRDWDALCAAEGLTAEASADKLEEVEPRLCQRLCGSDSGRTAGSRLLRCSPQMERTWPDRKSPRLSAPGSRAGSRTTLNASSFPSIPPLQRSSVFFWASGTPEAALHASLSGSGSALFGLYRTRGDAEAARQTPGPGRSQESVDPHPAAHRPTGAKCFCPEEFDSRPFSGKDSRAAERVGRSFNGRTMPFGGIYPGSNPGRPASFSVVSLQLSVVSG